MEDRDYGFAEDNVFFRGEVEIFKQNGIRESHAFPNHYMPIYNSLKILFPDILLLSYEGCQFMFRRDKASKVWDIINNRKNMVAEKLEKAVKAYQSINDLMEREKLKRR